jgi:hypothetical protein
LCCVILLTLQIGTYQPAGAAVYAISSLSSSNKPFNQLPIPMLAQPCPFSAEMVAPADLFKVADRFNANACLASWDSFVSSATPA